MTKNLMLALLAIVVAVLAARDIYRTRADYRRETVQQRTLVGLQRMVSGCIEQVDDQSHQIAELETLVHDRLKP